MYQLQLQLGYSQMHALNQVGFHRSANVHCTVQGKNDVSSELGG